MTARAPLYSDDKAPSDKIPLSQITMSTQTLRGEKPVKGAWRGCISRQTRDRPIFPSRVVLPPETEKLKPNGDCVAIEARSGFLVALVGHFRRFKLNPAVCRSSPETTVVPAKSRRPQMANAATVTNSSVSGDNMRILFRGLIHVWDDLGNPAPRNTVV